MTTKYSQNYFDVSEIEATDLQKGIAYHCEASNDSSLYATQVEVVIRNNIDINQLQSAWENIIQQCIWLRASFNLDGKFMFSSKTNQDIKYYDLSKEDSQCLLYNTIKKDDLSQGVDLSQDVLHRLILVKINNHESRLLWTHHHILFDATSFMKIINALLECYCEKSNGADYKQNYSVNVSEVAKVPTDKAYWSSLLNGVKGSELLYLKSGILKAGIARKEFTVKQSIKEQLKRVAEKNDVTLNTIVQSAWAIIQSRYENKSRIVFGAVRAFPRQQVENNLGLFINTLPINASIMPQQTFPGLLKDIRTQHQKIREQATCSLSDIYECVDLNSDGALFDVAFDFKQSPLESLLSKVVTNHFDIKINFVTNTHYPIMVEMLQGDTELHGRINYDSARYSTEGIASLINSYQLLLKQISLDDELILNNAEIIPEEDQHQLLTDWNDTQCTLNQDFLHSSIEASAAKYPEKLAITSSRGNLTYSQLNSKANQIAHHLRNSGVKANDLVAIVMEKGWEQVVAALAIMKAGGAYLPINADFPPSRIEQLLIQGEVNIVLTQSEYVSSINLSENMSCFSVDSEFWDEFSKDNLETTQSLTDLAYVIFTSGSTGKPKGVMIDHLGAMNTIQDINKRFSVTEQDTMLGLSALNFDLSVYDIFGVLSAGGHLVLPKDQDGKDPAVWLQLIEQHAVTLWNSVPALVQMLTEYGLSQSSKCGSKSLCESIRLVLMSGDWISLDLPDAIRDLCGDNTQIISLGGATEASIWSILYPIEKLESCWRSIPYGRPMWNQNFYILNDDQKLQPIGVPGELYIGGAGIAKGYWKDTKKTQASFIDHPKLGRLYRTGDMGRYQTNGLIEFIGRIDHQVKVRGYRIELGEIEFVLKQLPDIKDMVVRVYENNVGSQSIVAYYILDDNKDLKVDNIKIYARQELPSYMVPNVFIQMEIFPLSSNGKIDYKKLPSPGTLNDTEVKILAPENKLQQKILLIWKSLLGVEQISVTENFFAVGGHSLKALQLCSQIKQSLGVEISIKDVFVYPTIKELASHIQQQTIAQDEFEQSPESESLSVEGELLPAQKRIWFLSELIADMPLYNITFCQRIETRLEPARLEAALRQLLAHHKNLRAKFVKRDGRVIQEYTDNLNCDLNIVDVSSFDGVLDDVIKKQNNQLFDLETGPLLRLTLVRTQSESALIITVHHIVFDAGSIDILLRDLSKLYSGEKLIKSTNNPVVKTASRYSSYERDMHYWKSILKPQPVPLQIPVMKSGSVKNPYQGKTHYFELPNQLVKQLRSSFADKSVTLSNVFLTSLFFLLASYGQKDGLCIGVPVTLREGLAEDEGIGCFLNMLLARLFPAKHKSFIAAAKVLQDQFFESIKHRHLPYEELVQALGKDPDFTTNDLFQVLFSYQQSGFGEKEFSGHGMTSHPVLYDSAKFNLTTFVFDYSSDRIGLAFEYSSELFSPIFIQQLAERYTLLLEKIVHNPEICLTEKTFDSESSDFCLAGSNDEETEKSGVPSSVKSIFEVTDILQDQTEQELVKLYSNVLGVNSICSNDSFFELGGHSMLATKLLIQIEESFSIKIPLRTIFEAHKVKDLAVRINEIRNPMHQHDNHKTMHEQGAL